jgi:hypothetical protein
MISGLSFSVGLFLAVRVSFFNWQTNEPHYLVRLCGSLIGAYVPLIIALVLSLKIQAGNPFLSISIVVSNAGYCLPETNNLNQF